jgi:hypothetical protein
MREELSDEWSRCVVVSTGGFLDSGIVGVWVGDDTDENGAPSLRMPANDTRKLAHTLLRAADEAEGVNHFDALEALIVKITRERTAAFIRANIDMQGLDFPDAESVAVWLEES